VRRARAHSKLSEDQALAVAQKEVKASRRKRERPPVIVDTNIVWPAF
jgi:hypothetical protein